MISAKDYHNRTKHHLERYAAGPETLDWDDQPEAFRWFDGCAQIELPLRADQITTRFVDLYQYPGLSPQPLTLENLAVMLELSLGLSAWKEYGDARWPLRCNPSSGNLHAEEAYVIVPAHPEIPAGLYHYLSRDHLLEQRCALPMDETPMQHGLLLGLSSIQWREAWKYGERAFRYCQLDVGHALAAIRYAAACLGWRVELVEGVSDAQLATLLGLDRADDFTGAEAEQPELLLYIHTTQGSLPDAAQLKTLQEGFQKGQWQGQANKLSSKHFYQWPVIEEVSDTTAMPERAVSLAAPSPFPPAQPSPCVLEANLLIRRRRSAQHFDGQTSIKAETFYRILDMTLPRAQLPPWDANPYVGNINMLLFVHRVEGLAPGLYALIRNADKQEDFKSALQQPAFQWQKPEDCPDHLPLYSLVNANGQRMAARLACHQPIAAQSCFSLAMLGDTTGMEQKPWHYRRLLHEAGMIGQVLYLEAEAAGVQGTGIGCYFDDAVHQVLAMGDERWQDLYHFTVGAALNDGRIQTVAAYAHLQGR